MAFTHAVLKTIVSDNIIRDTWKRMMANFGIKAISALYDLRGGERFDFPEVKDIVMEDIDEAAVVAKVKGIALDVNETKKVLFQVTGKGGAGSNRSEMLVDVMNKRRTEIDYINGAVVRLDHRYGVPTPANRTLTAAIQGMERYCG